MHPMVNIAVRAARRAGRIITRAMDRVGALDKQEKAPRDFVSEVDREAEDAIIDTILRAYPDHGVQGEEHGTANEDAEYVWVIDPLDGTTNFLAGIPHFCVSIAVRSGPTLLHGVVFDPVRNELFSATRGTGARLNDRRIRVSPTNGLEHAVVATGLPFGHVAEHLDAYLDILRTLHQSCRALRRMGAAALELAYVAAGRTSAFMQMGLSPWDMAAGAVIVREAGGFVGDMAGGDRFMETGNLVAANPKNFRALLKVARAAARNTDDDTLMGG